mmetsp:Transcript_59077/g.140533  ORF Transcript_59077/g.140533 Transcript_59077/m.140533 type:complete len:344 (+) Transcript_59077:302-1333(+)
MGNASPALVMFLIISHMTVSSTMLVLNKAVLKYLPVATTVLVFQVGSSALILWVLGKLNVIKVDPFQISTARAFFWNAVAFMCLLFTNAKALASANVETVIVFRTLSIFVTAYGDIRLLQAKALSMPAMASLVLVVAGAIGYVMADKGFEVRNLFWPVAYGVVNASYPIVTKLVMRSNEEMTSWGRTYYNNLMTFMIFLPGMFVLGEHTTISEINNNGGLSTISLGLLLLSCIWGTAISFLGFLCLDNISATTFNVMGNANKILTLVVNGLLWEHHAPVLANICLTLSLCGSACYGEAKRQQGVQEAAATKAAEMLYVEKQTLVEDVERGPSPSSSNSGGKGL